MKPEKRIKIALLFVLFFLGVGTIGYIVIEGFSIVDALYMAVITVSTVGFEEVHPLSSTGRLFTVLLILFSIGSLAILAGAFSEMLIERSANPNRWKTLMEKKIAKLRGHVIICGHGRVGAAAAHHFYKNGRPFVVLEHVESEVNKIRDQGFLVLQGDGTREDSLMRANVKSAGSVLAVMDSDPENLFAVLTARELNPTLQIIARSEDPGSETRMLRAGADSTISPFAAAGKRVAELLMNSEESFETDATHEVQIESLVHWRNVTKGDNICGLTVKDVQQLFDINVVGLRSKGTDQLQPDKDYVVGAGDELLIVGEAITKKQHKIKQKKICVIDDNPVIVGLYTRLFQKAGFIVTAAVTGSEGLQLVKRAEPDAIVVDYHLPDMKGVELCDRVRNSEIGSEMKIFLFTADDQEKIRAMAHSAGIDKVVIKSSEAGEIVSLVSSELL